MAETPGLPLRSLLAMHRRWVADLERFEAAYPVENWVDDCPELEVVRNLATAIAQIEMLAGGMISRRTEKGTTNVQ